MRIQFENVINSFEGQNAIVVGHGGSANPFLKDNEFFKNKVIIGCNLWFRHYTKVPNFWVFANPDLNMKTMNKAINFYYQNTNNVVFYCDTIDLTNKEEVDNYLKEVKFLSYDHIHFNKQKCLNEPCCIHLDQSRNTVQEELVKFTGSKKVYSTGNSVLLHAICLSVLIGCKNIQVIGFDRNYRNGYCEDLLQYNRFDLANFLFDVPPYNVLDGLTNCLNRDLKIIQDSAKIINVSIEIL